MLGWLLKYPPVTSAQNVFPPFVAEGRLLTREFRTDTNLNCRTDASVVFLYSNGWWQVEARYSYLHLARGITNVESCMRIPDGTRSYIMFEGISNTGMTTASACPNSFPPSGRSELLVPWLGLCPHPELPLIDGKRIRRFINLPDYRPKIFNAPQNEGLYEAKYLAPEGDFLSELMVTNNGFGLELNVEKTSLEDEGTIQRYAPPFDNGYTELHYKLIESTNLNGVTFPLRAVCERFSPNWGGKNRDDLRVGLLSELIVTRISFSGKDVARRIVAPSEMFAFDARPPNLKKTTADYVVHDDQ